MRPPPYRRTQNKCPEPHWLIRFGYMVRRETELDISLRQRKPLRRVIMWRLLTLAGPLDKKTGPRVVSVLP